MLRSRVAVALLAVFGPALGAGEPDPPAAAMAGAARAFLASLAPPALAKAQLPFEAKDRVDWHYVPRQRAGLALKDMSPPQREAAARLLKAGLSEKGFTKVETIRGLEDVLAALGGGSTRDPLLYDLAIFGEPSDGGTWGWRFEGHHVSLNFTLVAGRAIASTPLFLGANPAEVASGPLKGTRALAAEEDLARAFVASLTAEQRRSAVVASSPPSDILTGASRKASTQGDRGVAWSALTSAQREALLRLLVAHAEAARAELADARLARVRAGGLESVRFAWMGGIEKGARHYYRAQGATFLVEYDDTQDGGNHIHSVWRDFDGDFGEDLLAAHYSRTPHR